MITYTTLGICSACAFALGYLSASILKDIRYKKMIETQEHNFQKTISNLTQFIKERLASNNDRT